MARRLAVWADASRLFGCLRLTQGAFPCEWRLVKPEKSKSSVCHGVECGQGDTDPGGRAPQNAASCGQIGCVGWAAVIDVVQARQAERMVVQRLQVAKGTVALVVIVIVSKVAPW